MTPPEGLDIGDERGMRTALPRTPWRQEFTHYLSEHPVERIHLNMAKGWGGRDVEFLAAFPHLRSLSLLHLRIGDISGIHALHDLRELDLDTYCRTELRFEEFPQLERLGFDWGPRRATSVFRCATLKDLRVSHMPRHDLEDLRGLHRLESLMVLSSPLKSLAGIEHLVRLRVLDLRALRTLTSLQGVERAPLLDRLEVRGCKLIRDIESLRTLSRLRLFYLDECGDIESLRPLLGCSSLQCLSFHSSTKVLDGDMSPIAALPRLRRLAFRNRRHYTHECEDFLACHGGGSWDPEDA